MGQEVVLLQRFRNVFVDGQPLPVLILKNHSPAEVTHLDLARFGCHLFADGRSRPDQISVRMNGEVIIQRELRALVGRQESLRPRRIFFPATVLQRGNVEESVRAAGVELGYVSRIECGPVIPDPLEVSSVGRAGAADFFAAAFGGWAMAEKARASRHSRREKCFMVGALQGRSQCRSEIWRNLA